MHHQDRNAHNDLHATASNDRARLHADFIAAQAARKAREGLRRHRTMRSKLTGAVRRLLG